MYLHWITYHIDCQSTKPVQKQQIYIISAYMCMYFWIKDIKLVFPSSMDQNNMWKQRGNPGPTVSPDLNVWKSKRSFWEKCDTTAKDNINPETVLGIVSRRRAIKEPAWLHLSWLRQTLLPSPLRRQSNMNGFPPVADISGRNLEVKRYFGFDLRTGKRREQKRAGPDLYQESKKLYYMWQFQAY